MQINQETLDNAIEIYADLEVEDGKPYRPANGTEGDIFMSRWCDQCQFETDETDCNILTLTYCTDSVPEWIYQDNKPLCTAFMRREKL